MKVKADDMTQNVQSVIEKLASVFEPGHISTRQVQALSDAVDVMNSMLFEGTTEHPSTPKVLNVISKWTGDDWETAFKTFPQLRDKIKAALSSENKEN